MTEQRIETRFMLDPTHLGVRLVILATMAVLFILCFTTILPAVSAVLGLTGIFEALARFALSLAIATGASWALERYLRRTWSSGKWLIVTGNAVALEQKNSVTNRIVLAERTNTLKWYFVIKEGRAWAPKGWYCVACRFSQDDNVITPYAFIKPSDAQTLAGWSKFEELMSRKNAPNQDARQAQALKQFTEQGQLRTAEQDRWTSGVEMSPVDFASLMKIAQDHGV